MHVLKYKAGASRLTLSDQTTLSSAMDWLITVSKRILSKYPTVSVDCEDIVQEVLCETINKLTQGSKIDNLEAYLRRAVANRSITRAKQLNRSRGILFDLDNGFSGYMVSAKSDDRIDLLLEKREQLNKCRNLLDTKEQLVFDMLTEGFAPQEIAELLSLSRNHVYIITHRLRKKLHYLLSDKIAVTGER